MAHNFYKSTSKTFISYGYNFINRFGSFVFDFEAKINTQANAFMIIS